MFCIMRKQESGGRNTDSYRGKTETSQAKQHHEINEMHTKKAINPATTLKYAPGSNIQTCFGNSKNTQTMKVRKRHTNSKNGCFTCKQRKTKCDERLPICSYCQRKGIQCSYLTITPFQAHRIIQDHILNGRPDEEMDSMDNVNDSNIFNHPRHIIKIKQPPNDSTKEDTSNEHRKEDKIKTGFFSEMKLNEDLTYLEDTDMNLFKPEDLEGILLPSNLNTNLNATQENSRVEKSYQCIPSTSTSDIFSSETTYPISVQPESQSLPLNPPLCFEKPQYTYTENKNKNSLKQLPLYSNSNKSTRSFKICNQTSGSPIIDAMTQFALFYGKFSTALQMKDFKTIKQICNFDGFEFIVLLQYYQLLNYQQLFIPVLRKTFLLFALDYYKNVLLKQQIFPHLNYRAKLLISGKLEIASVKYMNEIIFTIKNKYLPKCNAFKSHQASLFFGSFRVLSHCSRLHFKPGLKYDIDFADGKSSVQLAGIFSGGLYSVGVEKAKDDFLISNTAYWSNKLILSFKNFLIQNYPIKIFDEFRGIIEKLQNKYINNIDYENLRLFCEKHSKLLGLNIQKDSVLGFNSEYLIIISNSFESIFPVHFSILNTIAISDDLGNELSRNQIKITELDIIIYLCYFTVGYLLDAMLPSCEALELNPLLNSNWSLGGLHKVQTLMKVLKLIENEDLKLLGIYLIRTATFFKIQKMFYKKCLPSCDIESIFVEDNKMSIHDRYAKLKQLIQKNMINEIQVKTFMFEKGQFFRNWNYPNVEKLKPKRSDKVANNKIRNVFKDDKSLIEDFINNNNGLFSFDQNVLVDTNETPTMDKNFVSMDEGKMKMLWKLSTYIRINNL